MLLIPPQPQRQFLFWRYLHYTINFFSLEVSRCQLRCSVQVAAVKKAKAKPVEEEQMDTASPADGSELSSERWALLFDMSKKKKKKADLQVNRS